MSTSPPRRPPYLQLLPDDVALPPELGMDVWALIDMPARGLTYLEEKAERAHADQRPRRLMLAQADETGAITGEVTFRPEDLGGLVVTLLTALQTARGLGEAPVAAELRAMMVESLEEALVVARATHAESHPPTTS